MKEAPRFIIVDDDATSSLICEFNIRRIHEQADIQVFTNPLKALERIGSATIGFKEHPSILFLDINMPRMSAWEFLEVFQEMEEGVRDLFRIYILSSSIEDFGLERQQFPFVSGFLSKPMTQEHLETIQEGLGVSSYFNFLNK